MFAQNHALGKEGAQRRALRQKLSLYRGLHGIEEGERRLTAVTVGRVIRPGQRHLAPGHDRGQG